MNFTQSEREFFVNVMQREIKRKQNFGDIDNAERAKRLMIKVSRLIDLNLNNEKQLEF